MGWVALSFMLRSVLTVPIRRRRQRAGLLPAPYVPIARRSAPYEDSAQAIQTLAQAREGERITDRRGRLASRRHP